MPPSLSSSIDTTTTAHASATTTAHTSDPITPKHRGLSVRPFLVWLLLWGVGCLCGEHLSISPILWGLCTTLSLLVLVVVWWRSHASTMLALGWVAFVLGAFSPILAMSRQAQTMEAITPPLLNKRLFFEGVLLQPLQPRLVPPYRYPIPKRHLRHPKGVCNHVPHGAEPPPSDPPTHLGSAPFLLRRWSRDRQGPWKPIHEKIILQIVGPKAFSRGQWMRLSLKLRQPRRYANSGQSDPWRALASEGIRYSGSTKHNTLVPLDIPRPSAALAALDHLRQDARQWLQTHARQAETRALFLALLLGDRSEITPKLREDFARTGTSHLLAISGLHLALVGGCFFWLWSWLLSRSTWCLLYTRPRQIAALLTLPPTYLYAFLSGPSVSTQRALLMINIALLGVIFLRKGAGLISLFTAGCLILVWDPNAHTTPAFLLSFGSVFWLMTLGSSLQHPDASEPHDASPFVRRCRRLAHIASKWVGLPLLSSFLVMLGTLPVSLDFSPHFPLHGPLVNLIAIPMCGFLSVALGLLALFLSWLCPPLAIAVLCVADLCTACLIAWVRLMASFQSAILSLPPLRLHETLALLCFLLALAVLPKIRRLSLFLVASIPFLLWIPPMHSALQRSFRPSLQVDFLDVGQGDAIFLRFPNQQTMLVDAGGEAFAPVDVGERALLPYLRHQRIHRLDYVVMSHPHPDHFGGFLTLFQHIPVSEFWHNQQRGGHPHYRNLREILHKQRIPMRSFSRPTTRMIGDVRSRYPSPFPRPSRRFDLLLGPSRQRQLACDASHLRQDPTPAHRRHRRTRRRDPHRTLSPPARRSAQDPSPRQPHLFHHPPARPPPAAPCLRRHRTTKSLRLPPSLHPPTLQTPSYPPLAHRPPRHDSRPHPQTFLLDPPHPFPLKVLRSRALDPNETTQPTQQRAIPLPSPLTMTKRRV
jgi:DNA internalization-related competence protein ComEC/Rec2